MRRRRSRRAAAASAFVIASFLTFGPVGAGAAPPGGEVEVNIAYVPAVGAEHLVIEQPLGRLTLRAWDRPEVKIVARKQAPTSATLDRLKVNVEIKDGTIRVRTGVRVGDAFRALPPPAAARAAGSTEAGGPSGSGGPSGPGGSGGPGGPLAIDLTIDAPRSVVLNARTWAGDVDASGFRAGAELSSASGEVRASDIEGRVRTNALRGRQQLRSIRGDVEADGVTGDLELVEIDGQLLVARVVEGQITAREVRSPTVRLLTTAGGIVLVGTLRLGAKVELATHDGDIRVALRPGPFTLHARAFDGLVRSAFPLALTPSSPPALIAPQPRLDGTHRGGGASLELTTYNGSITLETAPERSK
jgi:hypothetical protein